MSITSMYANLKAAMTKAGHIASEGEAWTAKDASEFRDFCHFTVGIYHDVAHHVMTFPETFEAKIAPFIPTGKPKAAILTPVSPPAAPVPPVAPVAAIPTAAPAAPYVAPAGATPNVFDATPKG